jgi:hypothetical protein
VGRPIAVISTCAVLLMILSASQAKASKHKPVNERYIWQQRWSKATEAEQNWVYNTGNCESGNNPTTNTGNGFLGAFQYVPSTWWSAPNTGGGIGNAHELPHNESWKTQAVVTIKLARRDGTSHWPNCG